MDLKIAQSGSFSEGPVPSGFLSSAEDALKRRVPKSSKFLENRANLSSFLCIGLKAYMQAIILPAGTVPSSLLWV